MWSVVGVLMFVLIVLSLRWWWLLRFNRLPSVIVVGVFAGAGRGGVVRTAEFARATGDQPRAVIIILSLGRRAGFVKLFLRRGGGC